jgi:adenylosuccinate synthase
VTKLDVLDGCKELKICTAYRHGGKLLRDVPSDIQVLTECEPVYEVLPGWATATTGIVSYKALPVQAKRYLKRIEALAGCRIDIISTGSKRGETIMLRNPMASARHALKRK